MQQAAELGQREASIELLERLDGARWVRFDRERLLVVAWSGGHGIHAYDLEGDEVSFWNVGDFAKEDADIKVVRDSIERTIETGGFP